MAIAAHLHRTGRQDDPYPTAEVLRADRWLGIGVIVLGIGIAASALLGPLLTNLIRYRTDAMSATPTNSQYLTAPTLFWTIALEDLGVVLPAAVAAGLRLLRGAGWAHKAKSAVVGWLALVPAAVAAMAIATQVEHDPASSLASAVLVTVIGLACALLALVVDRPLFRQQVTDGGSHGHSS